jgi:hypothetical protein
MVRQSMGGQEELAGRDVILVHRLLKNSVKERLGPGAYALYSDACMRAVGVDPTARKLSAHLEAIDIIHRSAEANGVKLSNGEYRLARDTNAAKAIGVAVPGRLLVGWLQLGQGADHRQVVVLAGAGDVDHHGAAQLRQFGQLLGDEGLQAVLLVLLGAGFSVGHGGLRHVHRVHHHSRCGGG